MRPAFKEVLGRALRVLKHTRCRDMVFEVSKQMKSTADIDHIYPPH